MKGALVPVHRHITGAFTPHGGGRERNIPLSKHVIKDSEGGLEIHKWEHAWAPSERGHAT